MRVKGIKIQNINDEISLHKCAITLTPIRRTTPIRSTPPGPICILIKSAPGNIDTCLYVDFLLLHFGATQHTKLVLTLGRFSVRPSVRLHTRPFVSLAKPKSFTRRRRCFLIPNTSIESEWFGLPGFVFFGLALPPMGSRDRPRALYAVHMFAHIVLCAALLRAILSQTRTHTRLASNQHNHTHTHTHQTENERRRRRRRAAYDGNQWASVKNKFVNLRGPPTNRPSTRQENGPQQRRFETCICVVVRATSGTGRTVQTHTHTQGNNLRCAGPIIIYLCSILYGYMVERQHIAACTHTQ